MVACWNVLKLKTTFLYFLFSSKSILPSCSSTELPEITYTYIDLDMNYKEVCTIIKLYQELVPRIGGFEERKTFSDSCGYETDIVLNWILLMTNPFSRPYKHPLLLYSFWPCFIEMLCSLPSHKGPCLHKNLNTSNIAGIL